MQDKSPFLSRLTDVGCYIGAAVVFLMMVHICTDVVFRNIFGYIIKGTQEYVVNYYMLAVVFLPMAAVQRSRGHVFVEIFTSRLAPSARDKLDTLVRFWCALVVAVFFAAACRKALTMTSEWELAIGSIDLVIWPSRWVLAFSLLMLAWQFLLPPAAPDERSKDAEMVE